MARRRPPSRRERWDSAVAKAREALEKMEELKAEVEEAFEELTELKGEYEEWRENMSENLASSPTAEKLDEVINLDFEPDFDSLEAIGSALDDLEGADLPQGFGRD